MKFQCGLRVPVIDGLPHVAVSGDARAIERIRAKFLEMIEPGWMIYAPDMNPLSQSLGGFDDMRCIITALELCRTANEDGANVIPRQGQMLLAVLSGRPSSIDRRPTSLNEDGKAAARR